MRPNGYRDRKVNCYRRTCHVATARSSQFGERPVLRRCPAQSFSAWASAYAPWRALLVQSSARGHSAGTGTRSGGGGDGALWTPSSQCSVSLSSGEGSWLVRILERLVDDRTCVERAGSHSLTTGKLGPVALAPVFARVPASNCCSDSALFSPAATRILSFVSADLDAGDRVVWSTIRCDPFGSSAQFEPHALRASRQRGAAAG